MGERLVYVPENEQPPPEPQPTDITIPVEAELPRSGIVFDRHEYNRQWVREKRTRRLGNMAIAEGFIHTGSGKVFYRNGTGQPHANDKKR